jgi:hypothetical protein
MATIEVHVGPSYEGKDGRSTRTRRGWVAVGTNRETGGEAFRYTAKRREEARFQAWQYCQRHGHGMLTPRAA